MTNLEIINDEIAKLENQQINYNILQNLANLYTVRDNLTNSEPVKLSDANSEFLNAVNGVNYNTLLSLLDEHMEIIKMLFPTEYNAVISKILEMKKG